MSTEIEVHLLGRPFRFHCTAENKERLLQSAHFLNDRLLDVERKKKSLMFDNIAIEAALNIAHELLATRSQFEKTQKQLDSEMKVLQDSIEAALNRNLASLTKEKAAS